MKVKKVTRTGNTITVESDEGVSVQTASSSESADEYFAEVSAKVKKAPTKKTTAKKGHK